MKIKRRCLAKELKQYRFNSFFVRNMMIIILVILIPIVVIGISFSVVVYNKADKEVHLIAENRLSVARNTVDTIIHTAEMFAIQASNESTIQSYLYSVYPKNQVSVIQADIQEYISSFVNVHSYIHSVYVYSEKSQIIMNNNEIFSVSMFKDLDWMPIYRALPINGDIILPRKYAGRYPSFISIIRSVGVDEVEKQGCVVVNISVEALNELIYKEKQAQEHQEHIYLVDSRQRIYLSHDIKQIGQQYTKSYGDINGEESNSHSSKDYFYLELPSEKSDLMYISIMPNVYFKDMIQRTVVYIILMVFMLFLAGVIIVIFISVRTYAPIRSLLQFFSPQGLNDSQSKSQDEITYITESVKKSIERNMELEQKLQQELLMLNKAQLYALQTQINPHFINNVLEIISWTAVSEIGVYNKVSKMLKSLSNLLEVSLDNEEYIIPFEEELRHANLYTYIMSENYSDDLNFSWDLEDGIRDCKVLKLTLQPLLENAIEHGIKPKRGSGEINISGEFIGEDIQLIVRDDGVGMYEEDLAKLKKDLNELNVLSGKHIGIRNVHQRLKLIFGEKYGVSVDSKRGVGTVITILFPKIY